MSARVFNPLVMSEMRRVMRGGGHLESGRQSPLDNASIERVRKRLFEPIDHAETKKYVENQLASQQEEASKKWNFDFKRGKPRPSSDGSGYEWGTVTSSDVIPEAYALRRLPFLSQHADIQAKEDTPEEVESQSSASSSSSTTKKSVQCNKQAVITGELRFSLTFKSQTRHDACPVLYLVCFEGEQTAAQSSIITVVEIASSLLNAKPSQISVAKSVN